jgi:hypothetical protein
MITANESVNFKGRRRRSGHYLHRLRDWWIHRKLTKACAIARREVSAMSREQKDALWNSAINRMFPEGWWGCPKDRIVVGRDQSCPICGTDQALPRLTARKDSR